LSSPAQTRGGICTARPPVCVCQMVACCMLHAGLTALNLWLVLAAGGGAGAAALTGALVLVVVSAAARTVLVLLKGTNALLAERPARRLCAAGPRAIGGGADPSNQAEQPQMSQRSC
jgi:hypothetical protein